MRKQIFTLLLFASLAAQAQEQIRIHQGEIVEIKRNQ